MKEKLLELIDRYGEAAVIDATLTIIERDTNKGGLDNGQPKANDRHSN